MQTVDSFASRQILSLPLDGRQQTVRIFRLDAVPGAGRLPFSLKVLLENLLRHEDGVTVTRADIEALGSWDGSASSTEIAFRPARVLMQDFTGVPAVVDLAAMREAMQGLGGDPSRINPLVPTELVIDHSVIADFFGTEQAFARNVEVEYQRNRERYQFLRWGQSTLEQFRVVPPGTGIVHQVNLEHLARVVFNADGEVYPDTVVGTDSHTTMVNGLGVLGWGVGGIEAEAAMLGQPVSMLIPRVMGVRLTGALPAGVTATDLVLTITQKLRQLGVVGAFVEFFGPGVSAISLANRATIGNMSPEYGSTCAIFPIDQVTVDYLRLTGRDPAHCALVEQYARAQGLWHDPDATPTYSQVVELDLAAVEPSLAGPSRPQDRVPLAQAQQRFREDLPQFTGTPSQPPAAVRLDNGEQVSLEHGAVVIAAITSCTNTSNPSVMVAAALLAKKAVERGLSAQPWVKTTLAPGSRVVMQYYERAGLLPFLEKLGFYLVGYGCTTCIGNSGPLPVPLSAGIAEHDVAVAAVLSGNRNFEGRINSDVKMNYLASPPLVVAYALAGTMDVDLTTQPLGHDRQGQPVYLADVWPSDAEVAQVVNQAITPALYIQGYADVFSGDSAWRGLPTPSGDTFSWDPDSTYVRHPPYFTDLPAQPAPVEDIRNARVLLLLGDSVTTDHISPAGSIQPDGPAGRYLTEHAVKRADFNSYGARRGNHEVMIRGTFANIRLRNQLVPGVQGGVTLNHLSGHQGSVYDVAMAYQRAAVPAVILAGKEYGSGSSRDWAAKGTALLGVKAVIASSFERIHRSNLIGMGVLPLEFPPGQSAASLGLTGAEQITITGLADQPQMPSQVHVQAEAVSFMARVRIDTPGEAAYYRHGGILPYVLRNLASS